MGNDASAAPAPVVHVSDNCLQHISAHHGGQELVTHNPLVVPPDDPAGELEVRFFSMEPKRVEHTALCVGQHGVVKPEEEEVQLADDAVLVVPWVSNERDVLAIARKIPWVAFCSDKQPSVVLLVVEVGASLRPVEIDGIQIEPRRAQVLDG